MAYKRMLRETNGIPIQGFAPYPKTVQAGVVDVSTWIAYCFPVQITYQINGGPIAYVPADTVRIIPEEVRSITFGGFTEEVAEVMEWVVT